MNIVTSMRALRKILESFPGDIKKIAMNCYDGPIFEFPYNYATETEIDPEEPTPFFNICGGAVLLPFPAFKAFFDYPNRTRWELLSHSEEGSDMITIRQEKGSDDVLVTYFRFSIKVEPKEMAYTYGGFEILRVCEFELDRDGNVWFNKNWDKKEREIETKNPHITLEDPENKYQDIAENACEFMFSILEKMDIPGNFLALSEEKKHLSKDVTWRRGHARVVVLSRHHEANKKTIAKGSIVKSDEARNLIRTAHTRRAHIRVLRSPLFKNKIGNTIWVRSAWVGPKEWCDQGERVYRIVERPKLDVELHETN